jgi:hypothetical protein
MVPFSISAILMLLDFIDLGRGACIFGFAALALFLFTHSWAMVRGSKMQLDISSNAV